MNGFALRLVLKLRQKGTRKWPIKLDVSIAVFMVVYMKWNTDYLSLEEETKIGSRGQDLAIKSE